MNRIYLIIVLISTVLFSSDNEVSLNNQSIYELDKKPPEIVDKITKELEKKEFSILLGAKSNNRFIEVYESESESESGESLALLQNSSTVDLQPTVEMRFKSDYIGSSNFGYFFQLGAEYFKFNKQWDDSDDSDIGDVKDMGTSMEGYAIYLIPTIYYHFFRDYKWNLKLGFGVGPAYGQLKGSWIVTEKTHPKYGEKINTDITGFTSAGGILLELNNNSKHIFQMHLFGPDFNDDYYYETNNFILAYKYVFYTR